MRTILAMGRVRLADMAFGLYGKPVSAQGNSSIKLSKRSNCSYPLFGRAMNTQIREPNFQRRSSLPFVLSLLVSLAFTSGCLPWKESYKGIPHEGSYGGLRERFNETTNGGALRLIVVHGMGGFGPEAPGYSKGFTDIVAKNLGLSTSSISETNYPVASIGITNVIRVERYASVLGKMTVYELTWSAMTTSIKSNEFIKDVWMEKNGHRLPFNDTIKGIVDSGFGDAVLYLNPAFRTNMQEPILQTLEYAERDTGTNEEDRIIFVTHSLGSAMTFDAILDHTNALAVTNLIAKTTDIVMLANQLPLLSLGDETNAIPWATEENAHAVAPQNPPLLHRFLAYVQKQRGSLIEERKNRRERLRLPLTPAETNDSFTTINVVAITDPNDALSFPLFPEKSTDANGVTRSVSDFYSYNADLIFHFFILNQQWPPVLENPADAHTGYFVNNSLIRKLVDGFPRKIK